MANEIGLAPGWGSQKVYHVQYMLYVDPLSNGVEGQVLSFAESRWMAYREFKQVMLDVGLMAVEFVDAQTTDSEVGLSVESRIGDTSMRSRSSNASKSWLEDSQDVSGAEQADVTTEPLI
jgi:hypothetical protein